MINFRSNYCVTGDGNGKMKGRWKMGARLVDGRWNKILKRDGNGSRNGR
jgi:hypothetical protein